MAEFQWWLLIVGLVAGGGLVAVVSMDGRRREEDLADLERRAEATWIAERFASADRPIDARTVESVLRIHREYLSVPPPDRLVLDRETDQDPDEVRDDRGRGTDDHLAAAREEQAAPGQQADAGTDREERDDR
jgi:hypothetical protein